MMANGELLSDWWGVWDYDARKASESPDVGQIFSSVRKASGMFHKSMFTNFCENVSLAPLGHLRCAAFLNGSHKF